MAAVLQTIIIEAQTSILVVRYLTIRFPGQPPVVDGVSFELATGDRLGLLGLSGSGKSLTALALLGLLPAAAEVTRGSAEYTRSDGSTVDLLALDERGWREFRGREISLVFQEPLTALNPVHRVGRQLRQAVAKLCPELTTEARRAEHLAAWLRRVELPDNHERLLRSYPHELSGGQRQRLLIALALLGGPRLLVADEPTTALDTITEGGILRLLDKLRRELDMTLIFITHDLGVLERTTGRTLVMAAGKVLRRGTTAEILGLPGAGLISSTNGAGGRGNSVADETEIKQPTETVPALAVDNLSVVYPGRRAWPWQAREEHAAVRGVSFSVGAGEWVAIVGPSGCGKTTVARCLVGLLPPSGGKINGAGAESVQLVFQDPFSSLNPAHTVGTILEEVLRQGRLPGATADTLLSAVGLGTEYADRRPAALSGGQRQRVAIARALAAGPRVLIADEAVSALDAPLRASVLDLLDDIRRRQGIGLLFISHDLSLVGERADRVLIMDKGRIVEEGPAARVLAGPVSALGRALVEARR